MSQACPGLDPGNRNFTSPTSNLVEDNRINRDLARWYQNRIIIKLFWQLMVKMDLKQLPIMIERIISV